MEGKRNLLSSSSSSSGSFTLDQSDTTDDFQSYTEAYADRCGVTIVEDEEEENTETDCFGGYGSSSSSSDRRRLGSSSGGCGGSSSSSRRRRTRRRSMRRRQLLSSSSSSSGAGALDEEDQGDGYEDIASDDFVTDFLVEVCLTYEIELFADEECVTIDGIFLPLCERAGVTSFNSSVLNATDLTNLVTYASSNILEAEGIVRGGVLGIFITFENGTFNRTRLANNNDVASFELCLGNVTVNAENLDDFGFLNFTTNTTRLLRTIDVSNGTVFTNGDGADPRSSDYSGDFVECPIDGLPCFNFFFDAECPVEEEDDGVLRGCDCEGDIAGYTLTYTDPDDQGPINVRFTRKKNGGGGDYADVELDDGESITFRADDLSFDSFKRNTGVFVTDAEGNELCSGKIRKCDLDTIGTEVNNCDGVGLVVDNSVDNEGFTCDSTAVTAVLSAADDGSSYDNALINGEEFSNSVFTVFSDLDPYVKWSLIAIMITFLLLIFVACYICVARSGDSKDDTHKHIVKEHALQMAKVTSNSVNHVNTTNNTKPTRTHHGENESDDDIAQFDNEYYDDEEEEEEEEDNNGYVTHKKNKVTTKDDDDDDEDEYYDENDGDLLVEMAVTMRNDGDINDDYLE